MLVDRARIWSGSEPMRLKYRTGLFWIMGLVGRGTLGWLLHTGKGCGTKPQVWVKSVSVLA